MAVMPYDYIESGAPGEGKPNLPSPEGEAFGAEVARLTAPCLERLRLACPDEPGPCNECAFVAGTVPNRCLATVANALKCVVEGDEFLCHKGTPRLCAGWVASVVDLEVSRLAREGRA